jgi:cobalamin biosynthesis protein CbiG
MDERGGFSLKPDPRPFERAAGALRVRIAAFTRGGVRTARRIAQGLAPAVRDGHMEVAVAAPERFADATAPSQGAAGGADATDRVAVDVLGDLGVWTREAFVRADALVYVGAAGIAVRAIAPHVRDKFSDPAVLSVDEAGRFVVPLLSGHVGGANEFARAIAALIGAQPVISTATDVNGKFAVDEWARRNGLRIIERSVAKRVSAALLDGEPVGFASDFPVEGPLPEGVVCAAAEGGDVPAVGFCVSLDGTAQPFERTLHLIPRIAAVGVGCRKGADAMAVASTVASALQAANVPVEAVAGLGTIDVKRGEQGIAEVARALELELSFFDAQALSDVPGEFSASAFVEQTVGVDNVCERAAVACAGEGAQLVAPKTVGEGATAAVAVAPFTVRFEEERSPLASMLADAAAAVTGGRPGGAAHADASDGAGGAATANADDQGGAR